MDILRIFDVHECQSPIMHTLHEIGIHNVNLCLKHLLTYVVRYKAYKAKGTMILYLQYIYMTD